MPERQHQVFGGTVQALKWLFLSFLGDTKAWVRVKKILAGEGAWAYLKEILGCTVDTEAGTIALLERNFWGLLSLLVIPETQC